MTRTARHRHSDHAEALRRRVAEAELVPPEVIAAVESCPEVRDWP